MPQLGVELIPVNTAAEMHHAVLAQHLHARPSALLMAAAVADFRPITLAPGKLVRSGGLTLTLEPTEDIVAEVVRRKAPGTLVIAFAAEIPEAGADAVTRAREKMLRKGVDAIVVNDVSIAGLGFDSDRNAGTLLTPDSAVEIPPMPKRQMAARILDEATRLRQAITIPA